MPLPLLRLVVGSRAGVGAAAARGGAEPPPVVVGTWLGIRTRVRVEVRVKGMFRRSESGLEGFGLGVKVRALRRRGWWWAPG